MELIELKLKDILLNLSFDICDWHLAKPDEEIPKEITRVMDKIKACVLELPSVLEEDLSQRAAFIDKLKSLRVEYARACMPVYLYVKLFNQAGGYGMYQYKCRSAQEMPLDNYDQIEESIREYINELLEASQSEAEMHYKMSNIIYNIPLRMTKEKYYDIVRAGFKATLEGTTRAEAETAFKLLKMGYSPLNAEGYGTLLPEVKAVADELWIRPVDKLTADELESYLGEIDVAMGKLNQFSDYLDIPYNDINYMLALASFCVDEDYVMGDDVLLKDIFYSCKDMLESGEFELYAMSIGENASEQIEERYERLRDTDIKLAEYVNNYMDSSNMDQEAMSIIGTYVNIESLYRMEITDEIVRVEGCSEEIVDEAFINEKADELIEFIMSVPEGVSSAKNKYIRRDLLMSLPVIMSKKEFNEYLDYALEPLRGKNTGVAAITDIYSMLMDNGIIPYDDEDYDEDECGCGHHHNHEHHQHNHEHSHCDCGHNHEHIHVVKNHEHNCDCGHEH